MANRSSAPYWVFILILVVVHLVVHVAIGLGPMAPDLLTIAVLLSARRLSGAAAAGLGLALGLLVDALSLTSFGALAFVYTILGFLGARSRDLFEGDSLLFVAVYIFLGTWLREAIYVALTRSALNQPWGVLVTSAPVAAAYTALSAMIALTLYRAATGER
jgi:rod shape-determining protein MreD